MKFSLSFQFIFLITKRWCWEWTIILTILFVTGMIIYLMWFLIFQINVSNREKNDFCFFNHFQDKRKVSSWINWNGKIIVEKSKFVWRTWEMSMSIEGWKRIDDDLSVIFPLRIFYFHWKYRCDCFPSWKSLGNFENHVFPSVGMVSIFLTEKYIICYLSRNSTIKFESNGKIAKKCFLRWVKTFSS